MELKLTLKRGQIDSTEFAELTEIFPLYVKYLFRICLDTLFTLFYLKQSLLLLSANSAFSLFPVHVKMKTRNL